MDSREVWLFVFCIFMLGGLRFPVNGVATNLVAGMSIANQDLERYFHSANRTQALASEERIAMDVYTYAFLNYSYMENQQVRVVNYQEEKARYGEGKILTVQGKLIHISTTEDLKDDSACSINLLGTNGQSLPLLSVSWIALVRRGRCTFEEKVKNVYLNGAAGVIVFNDKPVMNLEKMQIKGKTRNITAVITYQDIGLEMAMRLDQGFEVFAHIIEGRSGMRPINSLNRTSVLFVAISFIILMVISLVWLIFYYIQKFRYMQTKDQQSRHLCSVTKKAIMKIPTKTGKSTDEKDAESDCCAICIEAYKASDLIRVLPCKHEFHKNCIDPWLIEHRTCPMCKLDVLKFYGYVVGDEINTTPLPQHMPTNNTAPLDDADVPIVVVGVAPRANNTNISVQAQLSSALASMPLAPPSSATETALAFVNSNNTPSRFTATQASVETQTITSIEPHSGGEDIDTHLLNYHRPPTSSTSTAPAPALAMSALDAVDGSLNYNLNSNSNSNNSSSSSSSSSSVSKNSGNLVHNSDNQTWGLHFNQPQQQQAQVNTGSYLFLGSEESIFEFPSESTAELTTNPAAGSSAARPAAALADLIRSRDFVIDFPRVFVLEGGTETRRRNSFLTHDIPERSQSSMGLTHAKDWMCTVANKLEEQHGLRRSRKDTHKMEMEENLLSVRQESMRMRRSHSTDGRYCVRKDRERRESQASKAEKNLEGACGGQSCSNSCSNSRRSSAATILNQFQPVAALKFDILNRRRKSSTSQRTNDVTLNSWPVKETEKKGDDVPNITINVVDEDN